MMNWLNDTEAFDTMVIVGLYAMAALVILGIGYIVSTW